MTDSIDSVNALLTLLTKQMEKPDMSEAKKLHYQTYIEGLEAAKAEILELRDRVHDLETRLQPLSGRLGSITDLPQELIDELTASKGDELENQIVEVIRSYGGVADLDKILIGLYRKFEVVQKRRFTQNKIWRMSQKDLVWSIKGKKGVYTVDEPDPDDKIETEYEPDEDEKDDVIPF